MRRILLRVLAASSSPRTWTASSGPRKLGRVAFNDLYERERAAT